MLSRGSGTFQVLNKLGLGDRDGRRTLCTELFLLVEFFRYVFIVPIFLRWKK